MDNPVTQPPLGSPDTPVQPSPAGPESGPPAPGKVQPAPHRAPSIPRNPNINPARK